jgi:hypothetical protein
VTSNKARCGAPQRWPLSLHASAAGHHNVVLPVAVELNRVFLDALNDAFREGRTGLVAHVTSLQCGKQAARASDQDGDTSVKHSTVSIERHRQHHTSSPSPHTALLISTTAIPAHMQERQADRPSTPQPPLHMRCKARFSDERPTQSTHRNEICNVVDISPVRVHRCGHRSLVLGSRKLPQQRHGCASLGSVCNHAAHGE